MGASWQIRTAELGRAVWDWELGRPTVRLMLPVRRPAADAMSRHAPVQMACWTTGLPLLLESGLEHEAARDLDQDPSVCWLVAQPVALTFDSGESHVVDLLAEHDDGRVVMWDVRPTARQDDEFRKIAELTRQACHDVGWEYAVFGTVDAVRRLNLRWLSTYRRPPKWPHHDVVQKLVASAAETCSLGDLMALDDGDGHEVAVMWHLLSIRRLQVDLDEPLTAGTLVTLGVERDHA